MIVSRDEKSSDYLNSDYAQFHLIQFSTPPPVHRGSIYMAHNSDDLGGLHFQLDLAEL